MKIYDSDSRQQNSSIIFTCRKVSQLHINVEVSGVIHSSMKNSFFFPFSYVCHQNSQCHLSTYETYKPRLMKAPTNHRFLSPSALKIYNFPPHFLPHSYYLLSFQFQSYLSANAKQWLKAIRCQAFTPILVGQISTIGARREVGSTSEARNEEF